MRQGRFVFYPKFFIDQVNRHRMWTTQILSSCKFMIIFAENIIHLLYIITELQLNFILIIYFLIYFHYIVHQYYRQATKNRRASERRIHFAEGLDFIQ